MNADSFHIYELIYWKSAYTIHIYNLRENEMAYKSLSFVFSYTNTHKLVLAFLIFSEKKTKLTERKENRLGGTNGSWGYQNLRQCNVCFASQEILILASNSN